MKDKKPVKKSPMAKKPVEPSYEEPMRPKKPNSSSKMPAKQPNSKRK